MSSEIQEIVLYSFRVPAVSTLFQNLKWLHLFWDNCLLSVTDLPTFLTGQIENFKPYIGEGNGTPLQYSCLENPMDAGAW